MVEYWLKPLLVGRRAQMHTLLVFLSPLIGGAIVFGAVGLLLGPLTMTAFLTLAGIYRGEVQPIRGTVSRLRAGGCRSPARLIQIGTAPCQDEPTRRTVAGRRLDRGLSPDPGLAAPLRALDVVGSPRGSGGFMLTLPLESPAPVPDQNPGSRHPPVDLGSGFELRSSRRR